MNLAYNRAIFVFIFAKKRINHCNYFKINYDKPLTQLLTFLGLSKINLLVFALSTILSIERVKENLNLLWTR